jgi:hypothetical protein
MMVWGECDVENAIIKVNPKKCGNNPQILRTLWHEIGHAFCWESGLASTRLGADGEEMFVETFSALICDLTDGKLKQKR